MTILVAPYFKNKSHFKIVQLNTMTKNVKQKSVCVA